MKAIMEKMEAPKLEVIRNDTPPEDPKVHFEFSIDDNGKVKYQVKEDT